MKTDKTDADEITRIINDSADSDTPAKSPRKPRRQRFSWTWIVTLFLFGAALGAVVYTVWFREDEKLTSGEYEKGGKLAQARPEATAAESEELIVTETEDKPDSTETEEEAVEATDSIDWEDVTATIALVDTDVVPENAPATNTTPVDMDAADRLPAFPGGDNAMYAWLKSNNTLTDDDTAHGKVIVSFIVEKNGAISDVRIVRGRGARLDAEAVRLVKSMPAWTPGENDGAPARIKYQLPITF